jgi:hypothetical protein
MSIDNKTDYTVSRDVLAGWGQELTTSRLHWKTKAKAMRWLLETKEQLYSLLVR